MLRNDTGVKYRLHDVYDWGIKSLMHRCDIIGSGRSEHEDFENLLPMPVLFIQLLCTFFDESLIFYLVR
jgi:hypothetical protein